MPGPLGEPAPAQVLLVAGADGVLDGLRRVRAGLRAAPGARRSGATRASRARAGVGDLLLGGARGAGRPPDRGRAGRVRRRTTAAPACSAALLAAARGGVRRERLARGGEALLGIAPPTWRGLTGSAPRPGRTSRSWWRATSTCRCWASTAPAPASPSRRARRRSRRSGWSARSATSPPPRATRPGVPAVPRPARPGAGAAGGLGFAPAAARRPAGARRRGRARRGRPARPGRGRGPRRHRRGDVRLAVAARQGGAARWRPPASRSATPVVVVAGQVLVGRREALAIGVESAYAVADDPADVAAALADPAGTLAARAERVARTWSRRPPDARSPAAAPRRPCGLGTGHLGERRRGTAVAAGGDATYAGGNAGRPAASLTEPVRRPALPPAPDPTEMTRMTLQDQTASTSETSAPRTVWC